MRIRSFSLALIALLIITMFGCGAPRPAAGPTQSPFTSDLENKFSQATALLYARIGSGTYIMVCTATAFERNEMVYHFVTAAHCVAEDNHDHRRVELAPVDWFISFDQRGTKNFIHAKILRAGYQSRGDDFAVLEVTLDKPVPVIPLASKDPSLGESVSNVASPLGLGKQLFRGHVTMERLDRPIIDAGLNWRDTTLLQINSGPGSSGSAIVSTSQSGITSILVGRISNRGSENVVSIPVSKFQKFNQGVADGKYPWYRAETTASAEMTSNGQDAAAIARILRRVQSHHSIIYKDFGPQLTLPTNEQE